MSSFRVLQGRNSARNTEESEGNENEFEIPVNSIPLPLPRTPLITISDHSQIPGEIQENNELDSRVKFEGNRIRRLSDNKKTEAWNSLTPRAGGFRGKVHSEPNSTLSTPSRCVPKVSNGVASGFYTGGIRPVRGEIGTRGGSSSRVSRGIVVAPSEPSVKVLHFEMVEDSSFWMDHNVQVLIRIRPLSSTEKAMQGHFRCLRQDSAQTLTWLGNPETRFTFDHVACETISQENLFKVAGLPMVENCMSGYNSCMFAYGQTGSGKTYTMMGEIHEMDGQLNEDCGMTPRIFEYLFMRIRSEEENRRDEKLRYSCKCSFLEIYNEQITDLLEPSSTNLQLREDMRKGVYVENLTEYEVTTVKDVVELLLQGAANRKMAATHMNSESSRSHSVFTCIIESRWDLDSTTHFRFGRLNLVDLAGSERQKSSGAEGERLKEAANINKSLSTLGLVIMSLVDVAHGKHRHVPYRDSRLTFLLQDSLGGNSKTTIIANISPSTCSANETLSTLKFAQRAKLIQNNAKVNEDASGNVMALQRQIQQLKDQLTFVLKHQQFSRSPPPGLQHFEQTQLGAFHDKYNSSWNRSIPDYQISTSIPQKKMKCIENTLTGALRREKMAETTVRSLEAEIGHMSRLVHQREEDAQRTKMILRFREEKIKRLELLADGLVSADEYLMEENLALSEEIQLLQARIDRNPELTRFALENIRLIEQLRMFEDFYERGERETLLAEVSELRDQLVEILDGKYEQLECSTRAETQERDTVKELEDCRSNLDACLEMNENLAREVDELQRELNKYLNSSEVAFDTVTDSLSGSAETIKQRDKHSSVQPSDTEKELMDARSLIEAMESEQVRLIEELDILQKKENFQYIEFLRNGDCGERKSVLQHEMHRKRSHRYRTTEDLGQSDATLFEDKGGITSSALQAKLDRMHRNLEEARTLNRRYQDDKASQLFQQNEVEQVRQQVEVEMAKTIFHLQDDLTTLQQELQEKLCCMTRENTRLRNTIASREDEIKALSEEWEKATLELTSFLVDGCRSLEDASDQIEKISSSFPERDLWFSEHVERAASSVVEKEKTIEKLQKGLEEAQKMGLELELKLSSLKGATLVITEVQQLENDENNREAIQLRSLLSEKISMIQELESKLKTKEDQIIGAERRADAAFVVIKRLSDSAKAQGIVAEKEIPELQMDICDEQNKYRISEMKAEANAEVLEAIGVQVEMARQNILDTENAIYASYADTERHLSALLCDILKTSSEFSQLVRDLFKDLRAIKKEFMGLKEQNRDIQHYMVVPALGACVPSKPESQLSMVHQIKDQISETNKRLNSIGSNLDAVLYVYGSDMAGDLEKIDTSSVDCFTSCSDISAEDIAKEDFNESLPSTPSSGCPGKVISRRWDSISEKESQFIVGDQELENLKPSDDLTGNDATILHLTDEVERAFNNFLRIRIQLGKLLKYKEMENCSYEEGSCFRESATLGSHSHLHLDHREEINQLSLLEVGQQLQSFELRMEEAEEGCSNTKKMLHLKIDGARLVADEKVKKASNFLNKFEEAQATMKEADAMLNTLLKANEKAKHSTDRWKQAGEELKIERASLIEEVQQLTTSICLQEREYESLKAQFHSSLLEITNSVASLEGSFLQMQIDVEERFNLMYSDIFSLRQDLLNCICHSRSSTEDIWSEIMEKGFALFVLYQCHIGASFEKISRLSSEHFFLQYRQKHSILNNVGEGCVEEETIQEVDNSEHLEYNLDLIDSSRKLLGFKEEELSLTTNNLVSENFSLKKELARKDILLKGLLFDLSLLQESTSNSKDIKDETEQMVVTLSAVQDELAAKTIQLDDILVQYREIRAQLADSKAALSIANSELEQAEKTHDVLSKENAEIRVLLNDLSVEKSEAEEQLQEKKEVIRSLENEILRMSFSVDKNILSSIEDIEDELRRVTGERDHLREEVISLNDKLDMANALVDENEAIAVEARQESEASKMYAEQKEEEAKILEHSVEELECTINVLEKKVYELGEEVERHRLMRDDLKLELQALRQRMLSVENVTEYMDSEYLNAEEQNDNQISRHKDDPVLELHRSINRIRALEKERAEHEKEIKECREYISELVLHAEAQASQYQQKYKMLEDMVREVKTDQSTSTSAALTLDKTEKLSRPRGSSSPFRCISSLVQQMNVEKDQELSVARLRIEELQALASRQQKEVCMLNARIAAAESMTHDVIRDLLGVKLDMTNYANLIDQHQVQKLVEEAQQQTEEFIAKEQEIVKLREQIDDLIEERESCIEEINQRESDILAAQLTVEQLRQRDQMLTAQNEMLKMDKTNLKRKMAEMDEMAKKQFGSQSSQQRVLQQKKMKENSFPRIGNEELSNRLTHSEKLLSHVNDEIAWYRKSHSRDSFNQNEHRLRNKRQEPEDLSS